MGEITVYSGSPEQTQALGRRIGALMPAGAVIAAHGGLGMGKTLLAAAIAAGMGIADNILSPTFVFFNEYRGRLPFCHIDAYRLEDAEAEELEQIGLDECFMHGQAVFVEWPQFIAAYLPPRHIDLYIERGDKERRRSLRFVYDAEDGWIEEALCG
ncbi:MAG: tRNA (adenosine(37)-N6)-threonylcarbamoyltransferase complex ATPase subunit type 1 TsaE [Bacillota bacterium]|nr:tRNA (adenosine(37)-N6)-threonylcarbamoyltransferase complex ATPase subunit type 1 TsaE [Bacillota bacterium]